MTFEETNRTFEFILQHEAQVSIHLEELAKNQIRHEQLMEELRARLDRLFDKLS